MSVRRRAWPADVR